MRRAPSAKEDGVEMNEMKTKRALMAMTLVVAVVAPAMGGETKERTEKTWVTATGGTTVIPPDAHVLFVGDEGGESFDLAELRDGETRTFGVGEKQVTVTRAGDVATLSRVSSDAEKSLEVKCKVGQDNCRVITFKDEPEKIMVVVEKTRECVNGIGDCEPLDIDVEKLGGNAKVRTIVRKVECDDQGNCQESSDVTSDAKIVKVLAHGDGPGDGTLAKIMMFHADDVAGDQVLMVCPEGDSTLHVAKDEADDTYLCPKHNVPMEKAPLPALKRKAPAQGK